jgi:hypothetical protein
VLKDQEGRNVANRKVFGQNTEKRCFRLFEHPLTLGAHLHDKHLCPKACYQKKNVKEANPNEMPKTLTPSQGQQKLGKEKSTNKPKNDQIACL